MGAVWASIAIAVLGTAGVVISARLNGRATVAATAASSLDARAQVILDKALAWQDGEIHQLRERVEGLEHEVKDCEVGRAQDRARFDQQIDELRAQVDSLSGGTSP